MAAREKKRNSHPLSTREEQTEYNSKLVCRGTCRRENISKPTPNIRVRGPRMNSKFYISDKINSITFFHGERRVDTEITDRYLPIMEDYIDHVVVAVFIRALAINIVESGCTTTTRYNISKANFGMSCLV